MSSHQSFSTNDNFEHSAAIVGNSMKQPHISEGKNTRDSDNKLANWHGGSGNYYHINQVELDDFILDEANIYILVYNSRTVWVGSARDLIEDSISRAQFRQALKVASAAFETPAPRFENHRISLISDLLSGHLMPVPFAA